MGRHIYIHCGKTNDIAEPKVLKKYPNGVEIRILSEKTGRTYGHSVPLDGPR